MILDIAAKRASLTPDRPALWWRGGWLTYRELDDRAGRLARALHARGVRRGDRASILAFNHVAHIDLILATAKLGCIYAPLNHRLSVREQREILSYLRPTVLLHDDANRAAADAAGGEPAAAGRSDSGDRHDIPLEIYEHWLSGATPDGAEAPLPDPALSPEDTQMILLTGGTTGLPKGAMQPYRQGVFNAVNTILSWGLRDDDCVIQATPCFHAAVNAFTVPLLHLGARVVLMETFEPGRYLELVEETGASILFLVPTMYKMLADHERFAGADLSSVRWAISGGAPCPDPVREAFAGRGVRFKQGYGLTEAGVNCFSIELDDAERKPASVGKPVLHARACVRRPDGFPADPGEVGELTMRGPHVFQGYFERPEATSGVLRDGWLWTGDLASEDDEGFFTIVGRRKEMFISGGENVFPVEIENALYDHPQVSECAVVGVPDERWGEVGLAVIVPRLPSGYAGGVSDAAGDRRGDASKEATKLDLDVIRAHLRERLASYKVPKHIHVVASLPKSGAGKILKNELAREIEGHA